MGMLEGAGIALFCFLLGRYLPGRRKGPEPARPPKSVCGCSHHHAYHDPATGQCHGTVDGRPSDYDKYGIVMSREQVPCTCRQYSGPVPLPEVYAPEIGG